MFAIYKRELKAYFQSFIGFLFMAVILFFIGLYFSIYNMMSASPFFASALSGSTFIFLLSVPVLTMRILAEERRSKTDQLILTAPVSVGGIVMGKFMALLTIFAIPMAITCLYPVIMAQFGATPVVENYLAILAFFLYGMTAIAIGVLVSALTESQVIAAVISFAVLFVGHMMSSICDMISSTGNILTKILGCLDLYQPFGELLNGTLNLQAVTYYISVTVFVLFLTAQSIQKRRYSVSVKNLSLGAYSTGMIAVVTALVVAINVVMAEMPDSWTSLDVTAQKLYSLTAESVEYVKGMEEDVTIYALVNEENQDPTVGQTLMRFNDLSEHITVEYVDPSINPTFHKQYTEENISIGSLIVVSDKRSQIIDYSDLYKGQVEFDYATYEFKTVTTGYDAEGRIVSAIDFVLSDEMPKIYITQGHNELELSVPFIEALEKANIEYETINLMDYDAVPDDALSLFINGPHSDFSEDDAQKIIDYFIRDGKVILVAGNTSEPMPNLDSVAEYMGLTIEKGIVVEQNKANYYNNPYYLLPTQTECLYTTGTYGSMYIFSPFSKGITQIHQEGEEDMAYNAFLVTSDKAFSKVSEIQNLEDYAKDENDIEGPFAVGIEAVKSLNGASPSMIVYGSEQIFTDEANSMVSGANLTLFANTLYTFIFNESSINIPAKEYSFSPLVIDQMNAMVATLITTVLLPAGALLAGFVIWFRRRKR